MAEQLVNEFTVNRPIDEAWPIICDVERIAPCLPGAELEEIEGDVYRGVVKVKLGAVTAQFKGEAQFVERDDANHRAVLKAEGRDTGGRGQRRGRHHGRRRGARRRRARSAPSPTDLHITGKVAQFGRGHHGRRQQEADGPVRRQPQHDARRAGRQLPPRRRRAGRRRGPTAPATADASAGRPSAGAGAATSRRPTVRKINGPAAEPVDLAGVAGPAVIKRCAPGRPGAAAGRADPAPPEVTDGAAVSAEPTPADRARVARAARARTAGPVLDRRPRRRRRPARHRATRRSSTTARRCRPCSGWSGPSGSADRAARGRRRCRRRRGRGRPRRAGRRPRPVRRRARRARFPTTTSGPRPSGGVGGTRTGVKCLHAHWAWHLAGGDDPVGRWIADRIDDRARCLDAAALDGVHVDIERRHDRAHPAERPPRQHPVGAATSPRRGSPTRPAPPGGAHQRPRRVVDDHLDDVEREHPEVERARPQPTRGVSFGGDTITALARPRAGSRRRRRRSSPSIAPPAEDVFRLVATESAAERAHNPGLPSRACRHDRRHVLRGAVGDAPVPPRAGHAADRRHRRRCP